MNTPYPHTRRNTQRKLRNVATCVALCVIWACDAHAQIKQELNAEQAVQSAIQERSRAKQAQTKRSASDSKIGPGVRSLMQIERRSSNPFQSSKNAAGEIQIYLELTSISAAALSQLREFGLHVELVNEDLQMIQGRLLESQIDAVAALSYVKRISLPRYATPFAGSVNTQGDAILRANQLRSLGFTGQNTKVGIISDGANDWTQARASGNLPSTVKLYGSCTKRSANVSQCRSQKLCNEGTAMAEIIHDLAPNAELAIGAVSTSLEFIQRINQLAFDFKADVIVDDLGFFGEPYFEDGPLAKAVAALPDNVLYVSSAGNAAHIHYENEFDAVSGGAIALHDFSVNDDTLGFVVRGNSYAVALLQWNDPFASPASDYDLFVTDFSSVIGASQGNQIGGGAEPIEAVCVPNTSLSDVVRFASVEKVAGADKRLEMFFLGSSNIEHNTASGSIFGHAATDRALAIASINAQEPGNNNLAFYSSRGPARIDFPARQDRAKPDLTAIDGVSVTGAGGFPSTFFGTSAAAPHVAGIAALLFSVSDKVTALNVKRALISGAVDLGATGRDSLYGAGRVDALAAKQRLREGPISLPWLMMLLEDDY